MVCGEGVEGGCGGGGPVEGCGMEMGVWVFLGRGLVWVGMGAVVLYSI